MGYPNNVSNHQSIYNEVPNAHHGSYDSSYPRYCDLYIPPPIPSSSLTRFLMVRIYNLRHEDRWRKEGRATLHKEQRHIKIWSVGHCETQHIATLSFSPIVMVETVRANGMLDWPHQSETNSAFFFLSIRHKLWCAHGLKKISSIWTWFQSTYLPDFEMRCIFPNLTSERLR